MAEAVKVQEAVATRRFNLADLTGYGTWLIPRLRERFPSKADGQLLGWLRGMIPANDIFLQCSPHAVALARFEQDFYAPLPVAVERFVLASGPEYVSEAQGLYDDMARWAVTLGAVEMQVGVFSDVPPAYLKERFGKTFVRQQTFVRLSK